MLDDNGTNDERPLMRRASDIVPKVIEWLWEGWIPFGRVSRIDGDGGLGKSVLTVDLVARATTGTPMPGEEYRGAVEPIEALILTSEDEEGTVRDRLDAAGADVTKAHVVALQPLYFPEDMDVLEALIVESGARLVVIDPLMGFFGRGVNPNQDVDVRKVLQPISRLASRLGVAVVVVGHLNKNETASTTYRTSGSVALTAAVRSAIVVARDQSDPESRRVVAVVKSNLARRPAPWLIEVEDHGGHPAISWIDQLDVQPDDLLRPSVEQRPTKGDQAKAMLLELLTPHDVHVRAIMEEASRRGIGWTNVMHAKRELGITDRYVRRTDGGKGHDGSMWSLPKPGLRSSADAVVAITDLSDVRKKRRKRPVADPGSQGNA